VTATARRWSRRRISEGPSASRRHQVRVDVEAPQLGDAAPVVFGEAHPQVDPAVAAGDLRGRGAEHLAAHAVGDGAGVEPVAPEQLAIVAQLHLGEARHHAAAHVRQPRHAGDGLDRARRRLTEPPEVVVVEHQLDGRAEGEEAGPPQPHLRLGGGPGGRDRGGHPAAGNLHQRGLPRLEIAPGRELDHHARGVLAFV